MGRSDLESFCLLFSENNRDVQRLKAMEKYDSGIKLAEIDLKLRGPGDLYGTLQHGQYEFKIADLNDFELVTKAKKAAEWFKSNEKGLRNFGKAIDYVHQRTNLVLPN